MKFNYYQRVGANYLGVFLHELVRKGKKKGMANVLDEVARERIVARLRELGFMVIHELTERS